MPTIPPSERLPNLPNEDEEAPPSSRRVDFGVTASQELANLERAAAEAAARAVKESSPEAVQDARIANKELSLFFKEHDNAGAFKFERFGRDTMRLFEERPDGQRGIEINPETGKFTLAESEKGRHLMFVNMGELDRVNKEGGGGHGVGDDALKETVHAIEKAVRDRIGNKKGRAADYTMLRYRGNEFMVSFDEISKEDFEEVLRDIRDTKPRLHGRDGIEPWPLVADGFELQEAVDILNQVQTELGPDERIDAADSAAGARELIEVMKRRGDYSLDVDKYLSRVGRVQEKAAAGPDLARAFFDNYMKKMFGGADLEAVAGMTKEEAERNAFAFANKSLVDATEYKDMNVAVAKSRAREIRNRRSAPIEKPAAVEGSQKLAEIPALTRGQLALQAIEKETGERIASPDARIAKEAALDLHIANASRDRGTGLLRRGEHYARLEQSFKEGKDTSMVFVDMGFLRYFDNRGGADVGNDALKLAADLMEQAIDDSGVDGKAFRYGGDEFTVQIGGGDAEVAKFQASLERLRSEAGSVPVGKRGSADGYIPTELVFNAGVSDTATAERVFEDMRAAGKYNESDLADPEAVANIKAELMTIIADKAIEEEKAVNRFLLLVDGLRDPRYASDPARRTQVENLITFSNKALFAEKGGGEFLRALASSGKDTKAMRGEIETWVGERVKSAQEQEGRQADLLNQLVEMHGKIRYYERALAESRHKTDVAETTIERLSLQLKKSRDEREQLINVRKALK